MEVLTLIVVLVLLVLVPIIFLARIPMAALIALSVFAGLAAAWESHLLAALGSTDIMDTLRISNQIYSVAVVLVPSGAPMARLAITDGQTPELQDVRPCAVTMPIRPHVVHGECPLTSCCAR